MMIMSTEHHIGIRDPLKEGGIQVRGEGHLIEEDIPIGTEGLLEEDPLMVEGPLMEDGGPLDGGGPPGPFCGQGPPGPQGPPAPVRPIIVQTPQVTLDTSALENMFDSVGQSVLQLARAQDQTNRQLQQHIQQGQLNMQAHTGALQQLGTSTYQRNFDYIFASIPMYDGSDREGFFLWLEHLEAACFYSGRNIKIEALGRSTGPVQNVIMALPNARSWRAIREELKRCFSDQTSL